MWKIFAGFIVFAGISLFVILKGGDKIDMQGEAGGHTSEAGASAHASVPAPVVASAVAPASASAPAAAGAAASK